MNSETWRKVEDLLNLALELDPARRGEFLAGISADDLRREVESLLAAEPEAENFLAAPAVALSSSFFKHEEEAPDALAGQRIGSYRIVRELGRGGMGAVYLAKREDGKFSQRAAVKLLKRELNTADIRRRFAHERHILSKLEHTHIARLLDAGTTDDGLPFIVMEYVDGVPVDRFCTENSLSLRARLELFRTVCETIAYAHRNLVIHRDLKPSNILVTPGGVPKLLDFGISKLLTPDFADDGAHTVTRLGAMTPEYASPEQLRGQSVTTATDVYSLGVILYELLTTHRPFEFKKQSSEELIRAVCTTDPQRPSEAVTREERETGNLTKDRTPKAKDRKIRTQALRGDLDNIALKALKKEPERRYSSVEQFSEDIRRHLSDLPVLARPDTLSYRATKFVNRHKAAVVAVALILLTLVGGVAATIWQARRAERSRLRAERRFNDVRKLSNSLLFEITPKIERLEGSTEARGLLVTRALEYLDSLSQEAGDDWQLQSELAAAYEKIGSLQGDVLRPNLGDFSGGIASYEKAQAIRRQLLRELPADVENRRLLAENLRVLSNIRWLRNDAARAFENVAEAVRLYEELTRTNPDSLKLQTAYLEIQVEQAQVYTDRNQFTETIRLLRPVIGQLEELRQKNPNQTEILSVLAKAWGTLGYALSWNNQQAEAEALMARAVSLAESLVAAEPSDSNLRQKLWAHYIFASAIYEGVDDARSFELCQKALSVVEETMALDKANVQARDNQAKTLSRLGIVSATLGKPAEALRYLESSARVLTELLEKDPHNTSYRRSLGVNHQRLGEARYKQGELAGALGEFEKAADIYGKITSADGENVQVLRDTAVVRKGIGTIHGDMARAAAGEKRAAFLRTAKENYQQALDILLQLQANHSLAEFDLKLLQEMRAAAQS